MLKDMLMSRIATLSSVVFAATILQACVPEGDDPSYGSSEAALEASGQPALDSSDQELDNATPGLTVTPQAASSSSIAITDGTRAAEAFFNRSGGDAACGGPCIALFDAKCDAHSVYVEYQINNGGVTRRTNSGGCNTTLRIPLSGNFNISYKACVDIQLASDVCGPTRFDHNP